MDDLTEEILAEMPDSDPQGNFIDLDEQVPHPVQFPIYESWVEKLYDAKGEFEAAGTTAVFSTWWEETDELELDACMTDERVAQILRALPKDEFLLRIKFMRIKKGDWVIEDKTDPVRTERRKGQGIVAISRNTAGHID